MMKKMQHKKGFTIVEVSLALVFVAIILITIAWLTIHITSVYEKGLAMKAVNSTAKEIIDDVSRAIATSPARTVESLCSQVYTESDAASSPYRLCINDNARKFVYQQRYGSVDVNDAVKQVPTNGVFCTGRYSYLWNSAYVLNTIDYHSVGGSYKAVFNYANSPDFRLLKISDYTRDLCTQHMSSLAYMYDDNNNYTLHDGAPDVNIEMLDNSENNLAIYDFTIFKPTIHQVTSAAFYSGTFILATLRGGIDINSTGEFCSAPPDNLDTDFAYCAINKFNFAMRAAGEKTATER